EYDQVPYDEDNKDMAEDKDTSFKVTDRRKFNPDGTPRDQADEPETAATGASGSAPPPQDQNANASAKVVSFPGEGARSKEPPEPRQSPGPEGISSGSVKAASAPNVPPAKGAAGPSQAPHSAAGHAYEQAKGPKPQGMPEVSFLSLVNMLAVEAAMSLGMIES